MGLVLIVGESSWPQGSRNLFESNA